MEKETEKEIEKIIHAHSLNKKEIEKSIRSIRRKSTESDLYFYALKKFNTLNREMLVKFLDEEDFSNFNLISTILFERTEGFVVSEKYKQYKKKEKEDEEESFVEVELQISKNFRKNILGPFWNQKLKISKNLKVEKYRPLKNQHDLHFKIKEHRVFKVEKFLPILWKMLFDQKNGEEGELLNNGSFNIFYVELSDKNVVLVHVYRYGSYWYLYEYQLSHDSGYGSDFYIFTPSINK